MRIQQRFMPLGAISFAAGLVVWQGGLFAEETKSLPVWQFQGVTPGVTTEQQLLAAPNWGQPLRSEAQETGKVLSYRVLKADVRVLLQKNSVVQQIDVFLQSPLDDVVAAFRLVDPLPDRPLPAVAEGLAIEESWRPKQFGCGRVIVFVSGQDPPVGQLIRFYGPDPLAEQMTNSIGMTLRLIPAGDFEMGSSLPAATLESRYKVPEGRFGDEHPQHKVTLTWPFYLATHEVTVAQFRKFIKETGYQPGTAEDVAVDERAIQEGASWDKPGMPQEANHPVTNVSWRDADAFCRWLSKKEGRTYRLPTEAEWEYACRGGTSTQFFNGDDPNELVKVANVLDASAHRVFPNWKNGLSANDGYGYTSPVGSFKPNAFGLYDMHGNVWEWCRDIYDSEYYAKSPGTDPQGPEKGDRFVYRGGCWF